MTPTYYALSNFQKKLPFNVDVSFLPNAEVAVIDDSISWVDTWRIGVEIYESMFDDVWYFDVPVKGNRVDEMRVGIKVDKGNNVVGDFSFWLVEEYFLVVFKSLVYFKLLLVKVLLDNSKNCF